MRKQYFRCNLFFSLVSVILQFVQSMIVTSFIQRYVGVEAYGYVSVIVSIVNVAGILTVALTSTCSRNMVIRLKTKDRDGVQRYFNTVLISLLILSAVCFVFFLFISCFIDTIMVISTVYLQQIRVLLWIVGFDFIVQLIQVPYLSVLYYEDKLSYYYIASIACNMAKFLAVVVLFRFWHPVIWAAYAGGLCVNVASLCLFRRYTYRKIPYLKLRKRYFNKNCLREIISVGSWISISKLAATLLSSCSTYLVNILVSVYIAGIYASIMQIQSILSFITISVVNVFLPRMFELYAQKQVDQLKSYVDGNYSMLVCLLGVVSGGLIVFGNDFMGLWLSPEYLTHEALIVVSVCYLQIAYSSEFLNQLLITMNRTKLPAIISVGAGVINVILAVVFVKMFDMGIFGIAIAQLIVSLLRSGIWFPYYTAKQAHISQDVFVLGQVKGIAITIITAVIGLIVSYVFLSETWLSLIICCAITGLLSLIFVIILNPQFVSRINFKISRMGEK